MPNRAPNAKISRIFFVSNMAKPGAPEIPLGYLIEAIWPDEARWLGLIGRTQLNTDEMDAANLLTWPELNKPFDLLKRLFNRAWKAKWGAAATNAQALWPRSPLLICTRDNPMLLAETTIETDAQWTATSGKLVTELSTLGESLSHSLPPYSLPTLPQRNAQRSSPDNSSQRRCDG
jgi:hypothetical protein